METCTHEPEHRSNTWQHKTKGWTFKFTEIVSAFWPQAILEQTTRNVTHRQMLHTDRCYTRLPRTEFQSIKSLQKNWGQFDSSECHVKVVLTDCSSCCCDQQESPHLTCVMCSRWTNWHLPAINLLFLPHLCHVCKVLLSFIGLCVFSGSSDWSTVDMQSLAAGGWVRRSLTHSLTHTLSTNTSGFLKKSPSGQNKTFPPVIHGAKYWEVTAERL